MENHEAWEEKLFLLLDGGLNESERGAVQSHLAACAICAALERDWKLLGPAIARLPENPQTEAAVENLLAKLEKPSFGWKWWRDAWVVGALASALLWVAVWPATAPTLDDLLLNSIPGWVMEGDFWRYMP